MGCQDAAFLKIVDGACREPWWFTYSRDQARRRRAGLTTVSQGLRRRRPAAWLVESRLDVHAVSGMGM
jgi:hypothetical protein